MENMKYILLLLFTGSINCLPRSINIPNHASPSEVNYLVDPMRFSINKEAASPNSIDDTVQEVEAALKANPSLPRLTKGEILDLLENITKSDTNNYVLQPYERNPKAIMKVLPFTPDSNGNNVEDLYTKPPITQIVGSPTEKKVEEAVPIKYDFPKIIQHDTVNQYKKPTIDKMKKYRGNQRHKNKYSTSTNIPQPIISESLISQPYNTEIEDKPHNSRGSPFTSTSTSTTPSSAHFIYKGKKRRRTTTAASSTMKYPNHRYEDETSAESSISSSSTIFPTNGIKVISPPSLPPKIINEDLLRLQGENQNVFPEKDIPVSFKVVDLNVKDKKNKGDEEVALVVDIPEHLKEILGDMNFEAAIKNMDKLQKASSTRDKPPKSAAEDPDLKNLLASLAVGRDESTTHMPNIDKVVDTLTPEMKDLLMNFGLIPNPEPTPAPLSDTQVYYETYNPEVAEIKQDSYAGFKPLPEDDDSRDEMQELLARFGLGRKARKQKSVDYNNEKNSMQMDLPKEYKDVLDQMDWTGTASDISKPDITSTTPNKQHVFNPSENLFATNEEIDKLNKLSNVVKHLESLNRPVTGDDFKKIDIETLKTLVKSLNDSLTPLDEQNAPDPLMFDYELVRNEVKRQENSTDVDNASNTSGTSGNTESKDSLSTSSSDNSSSNIDTIEKTTDTKPADTVTSADSSAAEETVTPNIKDLEDSFGGQPETSTETAPPPPKQNGFYYLFDWNTFFDMDDQKGQRVNLRFQPKVGDSKRFYSVHVP